MRPPKFTIGQRVRIEIDAEPPWCFWGRGQYGVILARRSRGPSNKNYRVRCKNRECWVEARALSQEKP